MKRAVIAVDFSDASMHAALYAAKLSNEIPLELHLLNIFHLPNPLQTLPIELVITKDELEEATDSQLKKLQGLVARELNHPERLVIHSENGNTEKEILRYAAYIHADLIITGLSHEHAASARLLGSTIDPLIRHSGIPVLNIPYPAVYSGLKHILIMNDGHPIIGKHGIDLLHDLQMTRQAKVTVVHLQQHREPVEKEAIMESLEPQLTGMPHSYLFPETEHISNSMNRIGIDENADLLVLQSHHHSLAGQLLGNDHTKNVSHLSKIPVLILPAVENR